MKINWSEIPFVCSQGYTYNVKSYFEHLEKNKKGIDWTKNIGKYFYVFRDEKEYEIEIKEYDKNTKELVIDVVGFNAINFKIFCGNIKKSTFDKLFNNVYSNPNNNKNSVYTREQIIAMIGLEKSKRTTYMQKTKVQAKCPDCGRIKEITMSNLCSQGISCSCGDGISFPEKVTMRALEILGIDFLRQKTYDGIHFYDFVLPAHTAIIETHGRQHYEETKRGKILKEQQEIDTYKREYMLGKNYKYYEVDCRVSSIEWIKSNLQPVFTELGYRILSEDEWRDCALFASHSLVKVVCDLFNAGLLNKDIAKKLNINNTTVTNYLKIGRDLGLCNYSEEYSRKKGLKMRWSDICE